ncbi:MAG TPA: tetratricopeptide repeat protein [Acidobacteriaceae bacterium]|nr:tetratricopeptide repeat protein [Acidobacteriaceae bacterium]
MVRFPIAACVLLLALPLAAQQQDSSTPPQQQNSSSSAQKKHSQQPPAHKPSTAEQNPFPQAESEAAARKAQQDQEQPGQDATPSAPAPQQPEQAKPKSPPAEQNPFPEERSEKAARQDQQQGSSSSDPSYSSSQSGLKGLDIPETNSDARSIHEPNLGKKDVQVGMFYLKSGDYKGAYDRFSEASRIDPSNADAVFGLAESARHLNHRDEAIRNYRLYLSALPDGPRAKAARKGLKDLGGSPDS